MSAIRFQHVSKCYQLGVGQGTLREFLTGLFHRTPCESLEQQEHWALRDVTFEVEPGEVVGLVGANGAGKSTILKLLSKVTHPSSGNVEINGRVAALIELGAGFHPDLSGRENVYLSGTILGMSRSEVTRHMDSIVEFAELGPFMDTPVKRYSSGMYVRLGFAVAIHTDPDVLLIDEVLAVGDARFRDKCMKQVEEFRRRGKTMVVVSHDRHMLERLCNRALLLSCGRLVNGGPVRQVIDYYHSSKYYEMDRELELSQVTDSYCLERPIEISRVGLCDAQGVDRHNYLAGEMMKARIDFRVNMAVTDPVFYCDICRDDVLVNGNNSARFEIVTGAYAAGDHGTVEVAYRQLNLLSGHYFIRVGVTQDAMTQVKYHVVDVAARFEVSSTLQHGVGLTHIQQDWSVKRVCDEQSSDAVSPPSGTSRR